MQPRKPALGLRRPLDRWSCGPHSGILCVASLHPKATCCPTSGTRGGEKHSKHAKQRGGRSSRCFTVGIDPSVGLINASLSLARSSLNNVLLKKGNKKDLAEDQSAEGKKSQSPPCSHSLECSTLLTPPAPALANSSTQPPRKGCGQWGRGRRVLGWGGGSSGTAGCIKIKKKGREGPD